MRNPQIHILVLLIVLPLLARANAPARETALPTDAKACRSLPSGLRAEERTADRETATADTVIVVDNVQISAIKQGLVLRSQPVAATIVGSRAIERNRIDALSDLSQLVPNFHNPAYGSRMTSSIYVRGLGARIDQAVVGLTVDNVPVMNKDNFDTELADIERIEVLRGPQSTLYGRNTMGGVVNIYTLAPLTWQGTRLMAEYGSGDSFRFRASYYDKVTPDLGMAVTGYYTRTGGHFRNEFTGRRCDSEQLGGGRWRSQWRNKRGLRIDNTFGFSILDQGGYPYAYAGKEPIGTGPTAVRPGMIAYNDPCSYRRTFVSDGLTVRYDAGEFSVASVTSYQYSDDEMRLDQDFLPLSYFTLRQARREHSVTEDVVFRSRGDRPYRWLFGAFGFYRHGNMKAPVHFKQKGIEELILSHVNGINPDYIDVWDSDSFELTSDFRSPTVGGALYHESGYTTGRWSFTAGLRFDIEHARLHYRNATDTGCKTYHRLDDGSWEVVETKQIRIDNRKTLARTFANLLPKLTATYSFDENRNLYASVAKGYKSGGFNTQMFSDLLQQQIMKDYFHVGVKYAADKVIGYKPEYSWNYEVGGHFSCLDGAIRGDFALFWIDGRDQQLTVFPDGQITGRMMANAGRTRSRGAELSLLVSPWRNLDINAAYGYTDARFVRYDNGKTDFSGNRIPYAPQHTLAVQAAWTLPTGVAWLGDVVLQAGMRGAGRTWWNEDNTRSQPFHALVEASLRVEHARYSVDVWCRNLTDTRYELFHFKSVGREFAQRGLPRTMGITLNIHISNKQTIKP